LHHRVADLEIGRVKLGALTITSDMLVYRYMKTECAALVLCQAVLNQH
ncbi:hypothetical protein M8C21_019156, partial [Ambrosia artemisiifolia]